MTTVTKYVIFSDYGLTELPCRFKDVKDARQFSRTFCPFFKDQGHREILRQIQGRFLRFKDVWQPYLKPTHVTNSNCLILFRNKNLKFPDFSCLFLPMTMKLFLFLQRYGFKRKMGVFDKFFKILPISSFRCKILISRLIFLPEIKRIRVSWFSS